MKVVSGALVLSAFLMIIFSSCQKEPNAGQNKVFVHDSTLINELVKLDTVNAPGQDTAGKFLFKYDAQDRLTKVLLIGYGSIPVPVPSFISEIEYAYSGNDTLPKIYINKYWSNISNYTISPPDYTDSVYLFYTGDKIMKDSVYEHSDLSVATITIYTQISSDHFRIDKRQTQRSGAYYSTIGTYNVYMIKQGDNIIEMKDTVPFFGGPQARKIDFTFDNKINPFKKISLRYPFYRNFYFDGYVSDFIPYFLTNMNGNNILSMIRYYSSILPTSFQYKYDYLNNNLPSVLRTLVVHGYNEIYKY